MNVLRDHTGPVLSVDFTPCGSTLATGSYDKTIRLFELQANSSNATVSAASGHSRDVYHTKRMQKVTSIVASLDASCIFSGSEDGQIRIWRVNASQKAGYTSSRQQAALQYNKTLIQKFGALDEIHRIRKNRHIPKAIVTAQKEERIVKASKKRKLENQRNHSKPGAVPFKSERKVVVQVKK